MNEQRESESGLKALLDCCPFCGRNDGLDDRGSENPSFPYSIRCCYCLSRGPQAETVKIAVKLWNERPSHGRCPDGSLIPAKPFVQSNDGV